MSSGASVKAIQTMLGHASAPMTLDVYSHLFADELEDLAEKMDQERTARGLCADFLRTNGKLINLPRPLRALQPNEYRASSRADARTRTGNRSITSQVRCQLRHAGEALIVVATDQG